MRRLRLLACRYLPGVHPAMESLVAFVDGRLNSSVDVHLARCVLCYQNVSLLRAAVGASQGPTLRTDDRVAHLLAESFEDLQRQMHAWCLLRGIANLDCSGTTRLRSSRIAEALEFYFGKEVAKRIQHSAQWDTADRCLIPAAKPLFLTFLGRAAGDAVADRILAEVA